MTLLAGRIAEFAASLDLQSTPAPVVNAARASILHHLKIGRAAGALGDIPLSALVVEATGARGTARVIGTGRRTTASTAAFVNGCLIHGSSLDDVYPAGAVHPGATVVPAAVAMGEAAGATVDDVVRGVIAGYEVACALSDAATVAPGSRGFRAAALYGTIGAAAGASATAGADRRSVADAVSIAASFASGLTQTWTAGSREWQFQLGAAARGGVDAALLAEAGARGARDALEGAQGFYAAFTGTAEVRPGALAGLGSAWRLCEVVVKEHPAAGVLQGPISAAVSARAAVQGDGSVERVDLLLPSRALRIPGVQGRPPFADLDPALMSASHCLAIALTAGRINLEDHIRSLTAGEALVEQRVHLREDPHLADGEFVLQVEYAGGRIHRARGEQVVGLPHQSAETAAREIDRLGDGRSYPGLDRLCAVVVSGGWKSAAALIDAVVGDNGGPADADFSRLQ